MKESKAVYVTRHKIRDDQNLIYQLCTNNNKEHCDRYCTRNFGCQYDSKRENVICTCRSPSPKRPQGMRYFSGVPKQVYAYHGSRSFADIGVGSVKALQRRKVKRVYLPETDDRGVGSSDLSSFITRRNKTQKSSYYDHKRTSSKCVGGFNEYNSLISQKLSPIVQTRSGTTSPKMSNDLRNIEIGSNTIDKNLVNTGTQFEIEINKMEESQEKHFKIDRKTEAPKKAVVKVSEQTQKYKYSTEKQGKIKPFQKKVKEADIVYSSDSLVQHIHNLENPSDEKQSRASIDPMENKLEREYRRMFSTKDNRDSKSSVDKPIPELKSTSILKRRFEALRRGLKKDDVKKSTMPSSQDSVPSRKDASVTSDPPSLQGRSFTDTKRYSPIQAKIEQDKNKINYKTDKDSTQWPQSEVDSECQGVKGMFNLWGKKFNFEDEAEKVEKVKTVKPRPLAIDINKKPQKETKPKKETKNKKGGRKFFFFKKKNKENKIEKPKKKENKVYTSSGVTAGRCEVRDGLIMKMGCSTPKEKISNTSEEGDEIQRRTWFKNFVTNTITSARSVNVRWNNSMYATSSSTVFELIDTIHENKGLVLKSRSEISSDESTYYRSYTKNKVYFDQNIEAWMISRTIPDRIIEIPVRIQSQKEIQKKDIDGSQMSDHRWIIEKSKAFANKIEVVLHSKNFNRVTNNVSSEYLRINIPKDFFDVPSSDGSKQNPTSDEEVYKIVEYESVINTKPVETVIKRPPMHRDVVIQGSNVNIPKRFDVIGVGIITQREMRENRNPILKIQDELSEDDSVEGLQINPKKCEFAESYLQEYYKQWTPLGMDLFSWCVSDSHLRSCSEKSLISFHNQGDGSKSCPNIFEDFQTSTFISSCNTSSCSQCNVQVQKVPETLFSSKLFETINKKFIEPLKNRTDIDIAYKRVLPKDSLEVFKRRKIYAASLKSQWTCSEDKPVSVPSIESRGAQNTLAEGQKLEKPIISYNAPRNNKTPCMKHVSMLDCDKINKLLASQLTDTQTRKCQPDCEACIKKGRTSCAKQATINSTPTEIPEPACKVSCEKAENPPCDHPQTNSSSSIVSSTKSMLQNTMSKITKLLGSPKNAACAKGPSPCPESLSPNSQGQGSPAHNKARRNAYSNIHCSPCPPPVSNDCLEPAPIGPRPEKKKKKDIKCIKCFKKKPCQCKSPPFSPAGSKGPSPKTSQDCLSPARTPSPKKNIGVKQSSLRNEKRCPKCLKKMPCLCKSPSSSPTGSIGPSPKTSHNCLSPTRTPRPKKTECVKKSSPPRNESRCPKCQVKQPCPLFPNCKLSPAESMQKRKGVSLQQSQRESPSPPLKCPKKLAACSLPPCNRTTSSSIVNMKTPPKSPCESDQFPWPMESQVSNPPSPSGSETSQQKDENKSSLTPRASNQAPAPKTVKQCKPNCANMKKKQRCGRKQRDGIPQKPLECPETHQQPCPTKHQQTCPAQPPQNPDQQTKNSALGISKAKKSGLFLKMKPLKRTCSKECLAWADRDEHGVVRLNSRENLIVSMKRETPSTEKIREGMNIKVQDDDGNTLFERKDYTCNKAGHRPSVLGDMYKDSNINRVSTPVMVVTNDVTTNNQDQVADCKSDVSLANLIEIQLKLRITQGDKTTEINIADEGEEQQKNVNEAGKSLPEVFVVENSAKEPVKAVEEGPKNDINIKIVVKNYKPKLDKTFNNQKYDDAYSENILNKFQTVSTGYSDITADQDDDNVFSIHRATIDLDSSNEKSKTLSKLSNDAVSEELTEHINIKVSSHSTEHQATDLTEDENGEKSVSSKKDTQSYENYDYTNGLDAKDLDTDQDATLDLNTSNECNDIKYNSKEKKKELLKRVFERAYSSPKNKENDRQLRDSLKIILTDSSDNEMNATSNELVKDVTYASLKPDYFRNTDSMNNYYKMESSLTEESIVTTNIQYPTGESNSYASGTSNNKRPQGCMCSRVAERLNCDLKTGCCCRQTKLDEITSCDIRNEQDLVLLDYRTADYVDVQTQNSQQLSTHTNRLIFSIHSHENYSVQNKTDKISIAEKTVTKESKIEVKKRAKETFSPQTHYIKECEMKKLNRTTVQGISDDDKIVLLSEGAVRKSTAKKQKDKRVKNKINLSNDADVLQCYETKKAVMEIYAEKTLSENGEHFVAKLPKFVYEKESEITRNYEQIASNSYRSVCKRNVIRMTVNG